MKKNNIFSIYKVSLLFLTILVSGMILSSCDSKDEPGGVELEMRGYWVCKAENLALEIISVKDYRSMKGNTDQGGYLPTDNVYQLWYIGNTKPQLYLGWTSVVACEFSFSDPDYNWRDKVEVSHCNDDKLYLEGVDFYMFERVTQQYFNLLVDRSDDNSSDLTPGDNNESWGEDDNSGGVVNYEAPEIGFYDYTAYPTKLTVKFKIYNSGKAKVTSATGYYGASAASKSIAATVSSSMIILNISGLSKGTAYKVKVTAKGPGGTTTSETVTCITQN